jgi:hypothetical protein
MKASPPHPDLLKFCQNEFQREIMKLYAEFGTAQAVADRMVNTVGNPLSVEEVYKVKKRVEARAAAAGWTPAIDNSRYVLEGYHIKGVSSYTDSEGNLIRQWVKTDKDKEAHEAALKEFIASLTETVKPRKPTKDKTKQVDDELMSGIFIGDSHFGMYATAEETKHTDYDSDIATELMREAIDDLVSRSPNSAVGLLVDVGDYMHSNSSHNTTFKGTPVDTDTRFSRVLRKAGQAMNHAVARMLEKFSKVVVVIAKGNHNPDIAVCVQEIVKAYYRNEPRVTVLETNGDFHYLAYGDWLIGINHGDKIKPEKLVSCMARDMPKAWGNSKSRMWAVGHYHHQDVKEIDGCIVQKFAALPPPDGWHNSTGYSSGQAMQMIVFKKSGGRHSTLIYELPRPITEPDVVIE